MPTNRIPFVPPGGFLGFAQQSQAVQALLRGATPAKRKTRSRSTPVRRRTTTTTKRKRRPTTKKRAHLVKGSAAAKRHMAKLRRMRRKKRR